MAVRSLLMAVVMIGLSLLAISVLSTVLQMLATRH
jgi:hypothetical protein